jgi:hypothetical protein
MGREVRRVPENWEHPTNNNGNYIPMFEYSYSEALAEWELQKEKWDEGFVECWNGEEDRKPKSENDKEGSFEDFCGGKPDPKYFIPDWEEEDKTHIQMYENTTEGTPISPVFDNAEDLAQWLVDNKARSFGSATATFDQWMNTIKAGYAPSMVVKNGQSMSGVEFM